MGKGRATSAVLSGLRAGASLAHGRLDNVMPVDALYALGRLPQSGGSVVLHAKLVGEGLDRLAELILQLTMTIFAANEWEVRPRRSHAPADTLRMFAHQVMREFLGEPCPKCKGHGVLGNKLDSVRHHLDSCAACMGKGFTMRKHFSERVKQEVNLRAPCSVCRGRRYVQITEAVKAERLKACLSCDGTGVVQDSYRQRARALHYDHMHIHRVWGVRFRAVLRELRTIERGALYECANFLFEDN